LMARTSRQSSASSASQAPKPNSFSRQPSVVGRRSFAGSGPVVSSSRLAGLPFDAYRLIASVSLVMMLLIPLFAPLGPTRVDSAPFITPQIDGSGSVVTGYTGLEIERAIFPYLSLIESSQSEI